MSLQYVDHQYTNAIGDPNVFVSGKRKLSYLTTFACQFCQYRYVRLLTGADPVGGTFQKKIDEISK